MARRDYPVDWSRGDIVRHEAEQRGDSRERCWAEGHLVCQGGFCGRGCACIPEEHLDPVEYPSGRLRVTTDKQGRTLCRECRYQIDEMGN